MLIQREGFSRKIHGEFIFAWDCSVLAWHMLKAQDLIHRTEQK